MKFSYSVNVKSAVHELCETELKELLKDEFQRVSGSCTSLKNAVRCDSINASFGSILRNDTTTVSIEPRRNYDGYNIKAETEYKPSGFFWVFFIIDIILIETVIGFILGMGITLGLYFYNKKLVTDEIINALANVKNRFE